MKKTKLKDDQLENVNGGIGRNDLESSDYLMTRDSSELNKPQHSNLNMPKIDTGLRKKRYPMAATHEK